MAIKLVKTKSVECVRCKSTDVRVLAGAKVCMGCSTYTPKELVRDIVRARK